MHSEKAATGRRALRPAQDYCHLCPLQRPARALRQGQGQRHPDEPCNTPEPCPSPNPGHWREDVPFCLSPVLPMVENIADHDHCIPHTGQVHLGPNHYPVPCEACSPPYYSFREVRTSRWDWPPDPRLIPCPCSWTRHRNCGCLRPWYQPELSHHFNGSAVPPLSLDKDRCHRYYRESRYVSEEHYWDCMSERVYQKDVCLERPEWDNRRAYGHNGHCEKRHVTFECHEDSNRFMEAIGEASQPASPERPNCNGSLGFFATEVPPSKFWSSRTSGSGLRVSMSQDDEPKLGRARRPERDLENQKKQRRSQGTVREKIKQVVTELEDVLGGLKQVQLEMKEVVQQIDILTSNIDLGEDDQERSPSALPLNPSLQGNRIGVVALVHSANGDPELLQKDGLRPGVKHRTNHLWSDHNLATAAFAGSDGHAANVDHTNVSSPLHSLAAVESADSRRMNHTSATEMLRTKSTANGDCLRARPPRVKVKDLQNLKSRGDYITSSRSSGPLVPHVPLGLTKTQKPPLYPQNGQAKMPQDLSHSPNTPKKKQISTTVV